MKNTEWLGAALCAALVACSAAPPRDAQPSSAGTALEPEREASFITPMAAPATLPMDRALLPDETAPPTAVAASPAVADLPTPDAAEVANPAPAIPAAVATATAKPLTSAAAKPASPMAAPAAPAASKAPPASQPVAATPRVPAAAPVAAARSLGGRLELVGSARQAVAAGEAADGVVYFLPKATTAKPKPDRFSVDTHSKGFLPGSLVVPVGSTVAFPNRDEILHNVYSATPGTTFDLGTYGPGQTRSAKFGKPGLVLVACNVHHGMRTNVLVMETPHYTRPGRDGRFELKNLPPGPGTLVFWHPRTVAQSRAITMPATPVTARLTAVRPRVGAN